MFKPKQQLHNYFHKFVCLRNIFSIINESWIIKRKGNFLFWTLYFCHSRSIYFPSFVVLKTGRNSDAIKRIYLTNPAIAQVWFWCVFKKVNHNSNEKWLENTKTIEYFFGLDCVSTSKPNLFAQQTLVKVHEIVFHHIFGWE